MAIQVSYSIADRDTCKRETAALLALADYQDVQYLMIVTKDEEETIKENGKLISVIPLWKWLKEDQWTGIWPSPPITFLHPTSTWQPTSPEGSHIIAQPSAICKIIDYWLLIADYVPCRGTVNCKNCKIQKKESINERKRHRKKFRWRFCFAVSNELLQNKLGKWWVLVL